MTVGQEFWQGVEEFNQQQFYACHDTLEAIWIEAPESDKKFYQGVLQVAVGCYHLSNYNWRGAVILLGEAVRRLWEYPPEYQGINVELLMEQASNLLQTLQQIEPEQTELFWQQLQSRETETNETETMEQGQPEQNLEWNLLGDCRIPRIIRVN